VKITEEDRLRGDPTLFSVIPGPGRSEGAHNPRVSGYGFRPVHPRSAL
jgi:hypothetical protein